MTRLLMLVCVLLAGCASPGGYQKEGVDGTVRLVKEAKGSGCRYGRATISSRPYVDASGSFVDIVTFGGTKLTECMDSIPPEYRSVVSDDANDARSLLPSTRAATATRSLQAPAPAVGLCDVTLAEHLRGRTREEQMARECLCGGSCAFESDRFPDLKDSP